MMFDPFQGVETPEQALVVLVIIGVAAMLLFAALFVFVIYKLKLFVPKSRLFDDDYVEKSLRNLRLMIKISRITCAGALLVMAVLAVLHKLGIADFMGSPLFLAACCVAFLSALPFFTRSRRTGRLEQTEKLIAFKRMEQEMSKHAPRSRSWKGYVLVLALVVVMITAAAYFSMFRSMGKLGIILHCLMMLLGLIIMGGTLPKFIRSVSQAKGIARMKEMGWTLAVALMFVMCAAVFVNSARDLPAQPVTAQMEVVSFTGSRIAVVNQDSGERVVLRINSLERQFGLSELWKAWKESRAFYGDTMSQVLHPEAEDRPLYCTVTYYPRSGFRVLVEDIVIGELGER